MKSKRFLVITIICVGIAFVVYVVAAIVLARYRNRTFVIEGQTIQLYNARLGPPGLAAADSVVYSGPGLTVKASRISVGVRVVKSILALKPVASLRIEAVNLQSELQEQDQEEPLPDSMAFPAFDLPVLGSVEINSLIASVDTVYRFSSGPIRIAVDDPQRVDVQVLRVAADKYPADSVDVSITLGWDSETDVELAAVALQGSDTLSLSSVHSKSNLWKGSDSMFVRLETAKRYLRPYLGGESTWDASRIGVKLVVKSARHVEGSIALQALVDGVQEPPLNTGALNVQLNAAIAGNGGTWNVRSQGGRGSRIVVDGKLKADSPLAHLLDVPQWAQTLVAGAHGTVRDLPIMVETQETRIGVGFSVDTASVRALRGSAMTIDSSFVHYALDLTGDALRGRLTGTVGRNERWMRMFVDTNVSFDVFAFEGEIDSRGLAFTTRGSNIQAFGAVADSLWAQHRIGTGHYTLDTGHLELDGEVWRLSGYSHFDPRDFSLYYQISHDAYGSASYTMTSPTTMEALVTDLHAAHTPYSLLRKLDTIPPVVSGSFSWAMVERRGEADISLTTLRDGRNLDGRVRVQWGADTLRLDTLAVAFSESFVQAQGRLFLAGKPFYDLSHLTPADIIDASVGCSPLYIEDIFSILEMESAAEGSVRGELALRQDTGFSGSLNAHRILFGGSEAPIAVRNARLIAHGDSLAFAGALALPELPVDGDSVRVAVDGVFDDTTEIAAGVEAQDQISIKIEAKLRDYTHVGAVVHAVGALPLPANAGVVRNVAVRLRADAPLGAVIDSLQLSSDTLAFDYKAPGIESQSVTGSLSINEGVLRAEPVRIRAGGDVLNAVAVYDIGKGALDTLRARGARFGFRWSGNEIMARDVTVNARVGDKGMKFEGTFGLVDLAYYEGPLAIMGTVADVNVSYTARGAGEEAPPVLVLSAVLDSVETNYRVQSFKALEEIFRQARPVERYSFVDPIDLDLSIRTRGRNNRINADIANVSFSGTAEAYGTWPYPVLSGRVTGLEGDIGMQGQSYAINQLDILWSSQPMSEGTIDVEAFKKLARDCDELQGDSCTVYTRLGGTLSNLDFSYETDCGGSFGSGANISSLVYSVRRGCYEGGTQTAATGRSVGAQALALLEPQINQRLTQYAHEYAGKFLSAANVSGLDAIVSDSSSEPVAISLTTREFKRMRFEAQGGYRPNMYDASPWAYRLGLTWRPPFEAILNDGKAKRLMKGNVTVEASMETNTDIENSRVEDDVLSGIGILFRYDFWKFTE